MRFEFFRTIEAGWLQRLEEWGDQFLPSREMRKNTLLSVHREEEIAKSVATLKTKETS